MSEIIIKDGIGWRRQGAALVTVDVGELAAEIERLRNLLAQIHLIARHPRSTGEQMILKIAESVDEQTVEDKK